MSEKQQQVITLDNKNSIEILISYTELAQKAGVFILQESDILKRCRDLLINNVQDGEINVPTARNLLIQAINKGQSKGCYTLDDASILHKVCQYVAKNLSAENTPSIPSTPSVQDNDLNSLSDPVPLRSGPRIV